MKIGLRTSAVMCAAAVFASCDTEGITIPPPPEDPSMAILPGAAVVVKDGSCTTPTTSFLQGATVCATFSFDTDEEFETQARIEWQGPSVSPTSEDVVYGESDVGNHTFDKSITLAAAAPIGTWTVRLCELTCSTIKASATFTVTGAGPATQSITFPDPGDKVYGDGTFGLAASASSGLPVSYSTTSTACSVTDNTATVLTAGTCMIRAYQSGNTSWAPAEAFQEVAIAPRAVTVTADPQTKMAGEVDPVLTYQVTSGVVITGDAFSGGLTREPGETVGAYAIEQGSLTLGANYDLDYVGANLTITPAVTWHGFFAPVQMGEVTPSAAGSTIPLGFRIYVDGVQYKSTEGITFGMVSVSCGNDLQALEDGEDDEIVLSGSTTLRYAGGSGGGAYLLTWQTPSEPGCYEVTVSYGGSSLSAVFSLW